ncbi:MAG TPA: c-type cytochrome [Bryobacteraceae bacterium]|jgi:putative heme-binding domain-containing protein|nr:c-type cytochrome [Bryobacteraceae bacterium]
MKIATLGTVLLLCGFTAKAQPDTKLNGEEIFLSNCAICHGMDGTGGRGPNLLGSLRHGDQDSDIANVIQNGVPGSSMSAFGLEDDVLAALVKHIQTLRRGAPAPAVHGGDAIAGEALYRTHGCAGCHRIGGQGSTFGPDLTRIGAQRSYEYLKTSILNPSADVPPEYETVVVETRDGKRFRGVRVNEDSFSVQLRLPDESFVSLDKAAAAKVIYEKSSFMPAYRLEGRDLENLLACLSSLGGGAAQGEAARQPKPR